MMGETFIGNPWSSLPYPINILFLIFPIRHSVILYLLLHFLLAGFFTFWLAKSFKLSNLSSFAAALFYTFSTKMLLHLSAGHITMIVAFSYFPLFFLSVRKMILNPSFGWLVSGGISSAFMYFTYPTIFYYAAMFASLYWLYSLINLFFVRKYTSFLIFKTQVLSLVLMVLIFLGLSAIVLLPQLEFVPLSTRSQLKLEDVALPLWNFKRFTQSLLFPYFNFDNFDHESFLYLGFIPSVLFVFGFLRLSNSRRLILGLVGFATLFFVAGLSTPIFKIAYELLPFLKYSRVTTRLWFAVALIVALVAAYALDKFKNKRIVYFLVAIFLFESLSIFYLKINKIPFLPLKNETLYQYIANGHDKFRVYCTTYCFNPQLMSEYKIQVLHGETPVQDAAFVEFLKKAGGYTWSNFTVIFPPYQIWQKGNPPIPNALFLGQANVKYVASTYKIPEKDFSLINKFENIFLYQNLKYQPRAYFENTNESIKITKYSPNSIVLKYEPAPVWRNLILADNFYPGWFAYTESQKFNVQKKEIFRKIAVPANSQELELKYQPESFTLGKTVTLSTIVLLIMYKVYSRRKQKNG